jgi:hypothetical protein
MVKSANEVGHPAGGDSGVFSGASGVHPVIATKMIATTPASRVRAEDNVIRHPSTSGSLDTRDVS